MTETTDTKPKAGAIIVPVTLFEQNCTIIWHEPTKKAVVRGPPSGGLGAWVVIEFGTTGTWFMIENGRGPACPCICSVDATLSRSVLGSHARCSGISGAC